MQYYENKEEKLKYVSLLFFFGERGDSRTIEVKKTKKCLEALEGNIEIGAERVCEDKRVTRARAVDECVRLTKNSHK